MISRPQIMMEIEGSGAVMAALNHEMGKGGVDTKSCGSRLGVRRLRQYHQVAGYGISKSNGNMP